MRILLLGDASNCHRTLATGLRQLGQEVVVASDGTMWMDTERDIDLLRRHSGKLGGLELWWRVKHRLHQQLQGFDIVAIHNPIFLCLRPHRCRYIFDRLRRENRSVFLTALGTDTPYIEECLSPHSTLRYNEFRHYGSPAPLAIEHPETEQAWLTPPLQPHCSHIYAHINGAVAALYEYHLSIRRVLPPQKCAYGGIPIDTDAITPVGIPERPGKVRLFLGRHNYRMTIKGTDRLETAARRAIERHPGKAELVIVENRPYKEYIELLKSAHVVIDQAYSYTPATNALLAMANGQCTVSGGEPEYYDFIGETGPGANRPIFNAPIDVDAMTALFEQIITHPQQLRERGLRSREFVVKHNSATTVARRFLTFWQSRLQP